MRRTWVLVVAACGVVISACSAPVVTIPSSSSPVSPSAASSSGTPTASSSPTATAAAPTLWLCRPGLEDNPCEGDLATTVIAPDGSRTREPFRSAPDPTFDCFYVYPTVSTAKTRNAPRRSAPEIVRVARAQAALFQRECRLYVPIYRQVTLDGLFSGGYTDPVARGLAQQDVVDAFREYLDRFSDGRPFLLLGHSQGATVLTSLLQSEIDGDPALRSRLVSAMLIGGAVQLAPGSSTKGSFQNVPPCSSAQQAGCVVAYNTYAGKPPRLSLFGRTANGRTVVCVNPGDPSGGVRRLDPIVPVPSRPGAVDVVGFVSYPGSVSARCRSDATSTWLDARRVAGSQLPEQALAGQRSPAWGLHRVDITLALGDLIDLASTQAATLPPPP
jgi:hypothetical protein